MTWHGTDDSIILLAQESTNSVLSEGSIACFLLRVVKPPIGWCPSDDLEPAKAARKPDAFLRRIRGGKCKGSH